MEAALYAEKIQEEIEKKQRQDEQLRRGSQSHWGQRGELVSRYNSGPQTVSVDFSQESYRWLENIDNQIIISFPH